MKTPRTGAFCCYCKRELTPSLPERSTSLTFDHVLAESRGGWKKVPCCRACNLLKGDLHVEDWFWFIRAHPRWWKEFRTKQQVERMVRERRWEIARENQARLHG